MIEDARARPLKIIFCVMKRGIFCGSLLILVFFFIFCKNNKTQNYYLPPRVEDGVTHLKFNDLGNEQIFQGSWSAPELGNNKIFSRQLSYPGGKLLFFVPQKEKYLLNLKLQQNALCLKIKIADKVYTLRDKKNILLLIQPNNLNPGFNAVEFILQEDQQIYLEEMEIYPNRLSTLKGKRQENHIFTPAKLFYYLNPNIDECLKLRLSNGAGRKIRAALIIETEKTTKKKEKVINGNTLKIEPIDSTIHKITVSIPQTIQPFVSLEESMVRRKETASPDHSAVDFEKNKNTNILIILLDAARADHIGIFGYKRNTSPNIDRLAEDSLCFTNCYAEAAYTLASTGTLLTGLPPLYHGVTSAFFSSLDKKFRTLPLLFQEKGFFTGAISAAPYFGKAYDYHKGFDLFIELFRDKETIMAEDFIDPFRKILSQRGEKPFFIYLHLREPHIPFNMPPPYLGTFQDKFKVQSQKTRMESYGIYFGRENTKDDLALLTALYDENLLYADAVVGEFLDILKKNNTYDNTVKVIMSDHGEALGERGAIGHNSVLHREGLNIPLIINMPGCRFQGKFIHKQSITSDLVITLTDLFDLDYPYTYFTAGKNLLDLPEYRTRFTISLKNNSRYYGYTAESFPYRMIVFPLSGPDFLELYDVSVDAWEKNQITGKKLPQDMLYFYFNNYLKKAYLLNLDLKKPNLRKHDLESLKSLGYIK